VNELTEGGLKVVLCKAGTWTPPPHDLSDNAGMRAIAGFVKSAQDQQVQPASQDRSFTQSEPCTPGVDGHELWQFGRRGRGRVS